jgi:hypothetical protein
MNRAGEERHQRSAPAPAKARGHDPREVRPGARLRDRDVRHAVAQDARGLVEPVRDRLARLPARGQPPRRWKSAWPSWSISSSTPASLQEAHRLEGRRIGKCASAARRREEGPHELDGLTDPDEYHRSRPARTRSPTSTNGSRAGGHQAQEGLPEPPEKRYRKIVCKPTASTLRVAEALVEAAPNAVTGMTSCAS